MQVAPYVIFAIAGLGFGFAAPGRWKWFPLLFPVALFLIAAFQEDVGGTAVIRLILALLVTAVGVLLGALLERRDQGDGRVRAA